MPELPEVETIRRIVERELVGLSVTAAEVRLPKLLRDSPLPDIQLLVGHRLEAGSRRAKILSIEFSGELTLMMHFKLSGQLSIIRPDWTRYGAGHPVPDFEGLYPHKTTHAELRFDDGSALYYSDVRQFGWWRLVPTAEVATVLETFRFGPEATGNGVVSSAELGSRLRRRAIPIKTALLDQSVIAGLGNIYVDEALHRAGIDPTLPANTVIGEPLARLAEAIPWALGAGHRAGRPRKSSTIAPSPEMASPAVHAREGQACPTCGAVVIKTRVGGAGNLPLSSMPDPDPAPCEYALSASKFALRVDSPDISRDELCGGGKIAEADDLVGRVHIAIGD